MEVNCMWTLCANNSAKFMNDKIGKCKVAKEITLNYVDLGANDSMTCKNYQCDFNKNYRRANI